MRGEVLHTKRRDATRTFVVKPKPKPIQTFLYNTTVTTSRTTFSLLIFSSTTCGCCCPFALATQRRQSRAHGAHRHEAEHQRTRQRLPLQALSLASQRRYHRLACIKLGKSYRERVHGGSTSTQRRGNRKKRDAQAQEKLKSVHQQDERDQDAYQGERTDVDRLVASLDPPLPDLVHHGRSSARSGTPSLPRGTGAHVGACAPRP